MRKFESNANYLNHFTGANFPVGVVFDPKYSRIPIAATVEGTMSGTAFKNEYNFFEFRTVIERRSDLYQVRAFRVVTMLVSADFLIY